MVDEPQTAKYGAIVAAPYISSLLTSVLPYLETKTDGKPAPAPIPADQYVTLSVGQALAAAKSNSLSVRVIGSGSTVVAQFPEEGTPLDPETGSVILYTDGAAPETVKVPRVTGLTPAEANRTLLTAGLNIEYFGIGDPVGHADVLVTSQSIAPGETVPLGSVVKITVLYPDEDD